jgi:hypothetical protein
VPWGGLGWIGLGWVGVDWDAPEMSLAMILACRDLILIAIVDVWVNFAIPSAIS